MIAFIVVMALILFLTVCIAWVGIFTVGLYIGNFVRNIFG